MYISQYLFQFKELYCHGKIVLILPKQMKMNNNNSNNHVMTTGTTTITTTGIMIRRNVYLYAQSETQINRAL